MFSKSNYKAAIFLEDDVCLDTKPYWTKTLQQVMDEAPKDWEILHLCNHEWKQKELYYKLTYPCYDPKFKTNNSCRWRTGAYLMHKRAALKIMRIWNGKTYQLPAKIYHVADYLLYNLLTTYVYRTTYFLIRDNNDTQIQTDYPTHRMRRTRRKILSILKKRSRRRS
jgi:GR25 family glycosyltransferase involved in LPS biosynthesis